MRRHLTVLATAVLVSPLAALQEAASPPAAVTDVPLFAAHEPIALTIRAPVARILDDRRPQSEELPGTVLVHREGSGPDTLPVEIRTRGGTRLQKRVCEFPPLRLDFPSDSVAGTLFAGQDKLKLVTHCQTDREEHEQYVLLEYLVYRTYQLLTDMAFRVRLARITYEDTERDTEPVTRYAFLIEAEEMVAARHGWQHLVVPAVPPRAVDPANLALFEVFQFFIGNTDFSAFAAEPGDEGCCHNVKPIGHPAGPVFSIPYDFDLAGLVNTRYANRVYRGNLERLGIRNVRQRLYRGWCGSLPNLPEALERFREKRNAIDSLYRAQPGLNPDVRADALAYIAEFYEIIDDERKTRRFIHEKCRS